MLLPLHGITVFHFLLTGVETFNLLLYPFIECFNYFIKEPLNNELNSQLYAFSS